jgi:uncharacterized protein YecE (DUF72 family)
VVTHQHRLADTDEGLWELFVERAREGLGDRLGVLLCQLPPSFHKDADRLRYFLRRVPTDLRVAIEFRHSSWYDEETFTLLRAANVALVENITPDNTLPHCDEATADFTYVRMHKYVDTEGPRETNYTDEMLRPHASRAAARRRAGRDQYVFFLNDIAAYGPKNAMRFLELALAEAGDGKPAVPGWTPAKPPEMGGKGSIEGMFARVAKKMKAEAEQRKQDEGPKAATDGAGAADGSAESAVEHGGDEDAAGAGARESRVKARDGEQGSSEARADRAQIAGTEGSQRATATTARVRPGPGPGSSPSGASPSKRAKVAGKAQKGQPTLGAFFKAPKT